MKMRFVPFADFLTVLSIALVVAGGLHWRGAVRTDLTVDDASKSFGKSTVGQIASAKFILINKTSKNMHIMGANQSCVRGGCLKAKGLPANIPANESVEVELYVDLMFPCDYRADIQLYTDSTSRPLLTLELTGIALPRRLPHDAN